MLILASFRIHHLPEPEKTQIQHLSNWSERPPESSTRSDSPILGLVQDSAGAKSQGVGTSGDAEQSAPASSDGARASPPSAATGETGGSGSAGTRIIPFQSLPQSVQEELGVEIFDDPLLTPKNMKKLQDNMKWNFKYMQVSLYLLEYFLVSINSMSELSSSCAGCCQSVLLEVDCFVQDFG
jgi:hypothetical protein